MVEASDNTDSETDPNANKSMFATATFAGTESGGADEIALDDPEFWEKLIRGGGGGETAEEEGLRRSATVAEEKRRTQAGPDAVPSSRNASSSGRVERKRCGQALHVRVRTVECRARRRQARRRQDPAHVAVFCRRYAVTPARTLRWTRALSFWTRRALNQKRKSSRLLPTRVVRPP